MQCRPVVASDYRKSIMRCASYGQAGFDGADVRGPSSTSVPARQIRKAVSGPQPRLERTGNGVFEGYLMLVSDFCCRTIRFGLRVDGHRCIHEIHVSFRRPVTGIRSRLAEVSSSPLRDNLDGEGPAYGREAWTPRNQDVPLIPTRVNIGDPYKVIDGGIVRFRE